MKTQRYIYLTLFTFLLLSSLSSFGQRNRHDRDRYYDRGRDYNTYRYPVRTYSYGSPFASLRFGSYDYRYQHGYFYRPYGSSLQLIVPPFGIRIGTLPYGYRSFYVGPNPYYYYNGTFYRPYANEYEVVTPPLGAVVDELPPGAAVKVIDGEKYYELNGTYYKENIDQDSRLSYTVVGTDGVLNTQDDQAVSSEPQIGDRIDKLPVDSKPVVIQGEKLYSTPSGLYYKEVIDGNRVYYELVGR